MRGRLQTSVAATAAADGSTTCEYQEVVTVSALQEASGLVVLANDPDDDTEYVYRNGLYQTRGGGYDYTISGSVLTFVQLTEGDTVTVRYQAPCAAADDDTPIGAVVAFTDDVPSGYLECDGSSVSTTTYSDLHDVIGYAFGGAGASFNLPDLRGRVILGAGAGAGLTSRALADQSGQEATTDVAAHTHSVEIACHTGDHDSPGPEGNYWGDSSLAGDIYNTTKNDTMAAFDSGSTGSASVDTMNPFTTCRYMIRWQ